MAAAVAMGLAKMCSHWEKTKLEVIPRPGEHLITVLQECQIRSWLLQCRRYLRPQRVSNKQILSDIRVLHLNAQSVRLGVGMVSTKLSLQPFVGLDTADVRFD